jgi:hypothetical protein
MPFLTMVSQRFLGGLKAHVLILLHQYSIPVGQTLYFHICSRVAGTVIHFMRNFFLLQYPYI